MKKIRLVSDSEIHYYSAKHFIIITPVGEFDNVADAVKGFPILKSDKHIVKCNWCNGYFLRIDNKHNRKKTCDSTCAKLLKQHNDRCRKNDKLKLQRQRSKRNIQDCILLDGALPVEFNQDDKLWGNGESNLTENVAKDSKTGEYDWEKELKVIRKEKNRLFNRSYPYERNLDGY